MRLVDRFRHWFRAVFRERLVERQVDEELSGWLDELTDRYVAEGRTVDDARAQALAEIGGLDRVKQTVRDERAGAAWKSLGTDARYAWRSLARTPTLTTAVVLTFALGIGANTAIFSVVNAMLLAPLPYRDSSRLVVIWSDMTESGYPRAPLSAPELADLRARTTRFDGLGAIWSTTGTLSGDGEPEQLRIGLVSTNFFSVLGVDAARGRTFGDDDEAATASAGVVLSWGLYERRFGADPQLIGRRITLNGRPTTVIGVMPRDFQVLMPADASVPADLQAWTFLKSAALTRPPRGQQYLRVIGRMKRGVTVAEAREDVSTVAAAISKAFEYGPTGRRFTTLPLQGDNVRDIRPALLILAGGVAILLLIASVNVTGLLVARAAGRRRETALSLALGAGRSRLFRQYLAEGLLLSALGAVAGVGAGWAALHGLLLWRPASLARIDRASIDLTVLAVTGGVTIAIGMVLSLAPLSETFRTNVLEVLQRGGQRAGNTVALRTRAWLVVTEVALSTVLLIGAGLLARTFVNIQQRDLGFSAGSALTFRLSVPFSRYPSLDAINTFSRDLADRLRALPGVTNAGAISHVPFDDLPNWGGPYTTTAGADPTSAPSADYRAVSPGLLETIGAHLVEGRLFTEADDSTHPLVVVVDDLLARRAWPGESAIGRKIVVDPGSSGLPTVGAEVIGVVSHLRVRSVVEDLAEQTYFSVRQVARNPMAYVVRSDVDPSALAASVRQIVSRMDPAIPVYDARPFAGYVNEARASSRFLALLAAVFAAVALLLTAVGVYGVAAYAVGARQREFGVRLALGAAPAQVRRLLLTQAGALAAAGLAAGVGVAAVAARFFRHQLVGVTPLDPRTYAAALCVLGAVILAACWLPARRASTANPVEVLGRE